MRLGVSGWGALGDCSKGDAYWGRGGRLSLQRAAHTTGEGEANSGKGVWGWAPRS